jgi:hypothetical protein
MRSVALSAEMGLLNAAGWEGLTKPHPVPQKIFSELTPNRPPAILFDPHRRAGSRFLDILETEGAPIFGTGVDWPPEASLDHGGTSLRIPLVLALTQAIQIKMQEKAPTWPLRREYLDSPPAAVEITDAVGFYTLRALERLKSRPTSDVERVILAVPNCSTSDAMSRILRGTTGRLRLIWRPVATLLGALASDKQEVSKLGKDDFVLVLHLGLDGFEATLLHVHEHCGMKGPTIRVPARPRFIDGKNNISDSSLGVLRWTRDCTAGSRNMKFGEFWSRCWATSVNTKTVPFQINHELVGPWDTGENSYQENALQPFKKFWTSDLKQLYTGKANQFLQSAHKMMNDYSPKVVILSGSFVHSGDEFIQALTLNNEKKFQVILDPVAVESGAALFGWREKSQWATYLDHLSQIELCVEEGDEGTSKWFPLVEKGWVDAGLQFRNKRGGFRLRAGSKELKLAVTLEGELHVREASGRVEISDLKSANDIPLDIHVEVQAATGHPVVTARGEVGIPPVVLDWAEAKSTDKTPQEYLDALPRSYPPLEPLHAAPWWSRPTQWHTQKWEARDVSLLDYITNINKRMTSRTNLRTDWLESVRKEIIKRKWNGQAWDAICDLSGNPRSQPEVLDVFRQHVWEKLKEDWLDPKIIITEKSGLIKILAFSCFQDSAFEKRVVSELLKKKKLDSQSSNDPRKPGPWMYAVGNAVKKSENARIAISILVRSIHFRLEVAENTETKLSVVNDPLKQLSWLLAHRSDATRDLSTEEAMSAVDAFMGCAKQLYKEGNVKIMFRWAIRCLALILRRRNFDSNFLSPESEEANVILKFCAQVYVDLCPDDLFKKQLASKYGVRRSRNQLADLSDQMRNLTLGHLKVFIDYVNRQGTGSIIIDGVDDDDE